MSVDQKLKDKIVKSKIIKKEDIDNAPNWAISLAALLLKVSDLEQYCDGEVTDFDKHKFLEEIYKIQDLIDLKNCDRVSENYSESMQSFPIGIPVKLIPFLRDMMGEIKQSL